MAMKHRHLPLLAAGLFCALAVLLGALWHLSRPGTDPGVKTITVEVLHGDGSKAGFTFSTDAEFLGPAMLEQDLISGQDSGYGLFVDTVDGERASYEENRSWWSLSCNGEMAQAGADSVPLHDGDTFVWTYTVDP